MRKETQLPDWKKDKYEVGDGKDTPVRKSELRGDAKHNAGRHGDSQGRKDYTAVEGTILPAILDRDPAKSVKPHAIAPAAPVSTHGKPHWTPAVDAGADPSMIPIPQSGHDNHSQPSQGDSGSAGWKSKNYDTTGDYASLPEGELKNKWTK